MKKDKNAHNGQVINIPTSCDATLIAQVCHYETIGARGVVVDEGDVVCLVCGDDSTDTKNEVVITLTASQARMLAKVIDAMAEEINLPFLGGRTGRFLCLPVPSTMFVACARGEAFERVTY